MSDTSLSQAAVLASRFINQTNRHVFLTGKAGTGKTTFLKHIIQHTHKKAVIAAPTGIAAINAGGVTLHSLFQLPFGAFIPKHQYELNAIPEGPFNNITSLVSGNKMHSGKRQLLRELELLIIDEVSMLRADLLDAIDTVLRVVRRKNNIPFGGVQCLFIGDLLQLPPVVKDNEWFILKNYYNSIFFFDAIALILNKPLYIELRKIYRQNDEQFISLLNNMRTNNITTTDVELLNKHYKPGYLIDSKENTITLTTHNYKADAINKSFLDRLPGKEFTYHAETEDDFPEYLYPLEAVLKLKVGAQIMFVKNDYSGSQKYFNGKIGRIHELGENYIEVEFEDKRIIKVEKYEWENKKYQLNSVTNEIDETVSGKFIHYPIKLAWAITVHKSQGLTFEKAIIDVEQAFAPGQVYVALSRLKSLDGLTLTSRVNFDNVLTDTSVSSYSKEAEHQPDPEIQLQNETVQYLNEYLLQCFDFTELLHSCKSHAASYAKEDKKNIRTKFKSEIEELLPQIETTAGTGEKFRTQIQKIISGKEKDFLILLKNRVSDACNYFDPILKTNSKKLRMILEKLKSEKKAKQYANELIELENQFFEQQKKFVKASALCSSVLTGEELKRETTQELLSNRITEKTTQKKSLNKKERSKKEAKISTKEISYKLYKEGLRIEEIAEQQKLAVSTIEGHLALYIKNGMIPAEELVESSKIKPITLVQQELQTFQLGPIKQLLGDEYSYSDIRYVVASLQKEN